jgi:dienelactone hydrolase
MRQRRGGGRWLAAAAGTVLVAGVGPSSAGAVAPVSVPKTATTATGAGPPTPAVAEQAVQVPQRGGGALAGVLLTPAGPGPYPLVVALPGGFVGPGAIAWATHELAAAGYVVLAVDPARDTPASHDVAARSGLDFALSDANPALGLVDADAVGVTGWSLGARSLTLTQAEDDRVDALVAWDNLAVSETGDAGSPACRNTPAPVRPARVPALGQASVSCPNAAAEAKKTGYEHWRAAGLPTMQVVLAGCSHGCWGANGPAAGRRVASHYTLAWFDRWLKHDPTATGRLLAAEVDGRPLADVLSARYTSAAHLDGVDCPDVRAGC